MGDCPKCGLADPGPVDFCPNPECRTYLGWASAAGTPSPRVPTPAPPIDTQPMVPGPASSPPNPPVQTPLPPAPPASPPQKRGVRVTVDPTELTVDPGGEVIATVTVRNLGTRVEEFQLTPGGAAASFTSISPTTLSVYPEDEQPAVARFAPVRGPQSPAGVAPFEIVARSGIHGDVSDVARGRITVTPFTDLKAVLQPEVSRGRRPGQHRVRVTNDGNTPVTAEIAFRDQDGELTFQPPSGTATLPAGATMDYSVRVNGKHRWFGRTQRHPFSAVLTPAGAQPPTTLNGTRQQTAVFPWWIPTAAAVILAFLTALVFYLKPGADTVPQVADFTQSDAEKTLRDKGYLVNGATPISDAKRAGLVVKTDPIAGTPLKKQERVQVFVSTGPCNPVCKVTVPPTKGQREADARTILGNAGFTVGRVVSGPSELPAGTVKETSPAEGTEALTNNPVVVFTSSGADLKLAPEALASFRGQSPADVQKALGSNFTITQIREHSNDVAAGKVLRVLQDQSNPKRVTLVLALPTATDLVALASKASWSSSAGPLTFPGKRNDPRGAVEVAKTGTGKALGTFPPNIATKSITGLFTLAANQKIILGDHLKGTIGLANANALGPVQFTVEIGGRNVLQLSVEPGKSMTFDQPLDDVVDASTIKISVTGDPSSSPNGPVFDLAPAPGGAAATPATVSLAFWQDLGIKGVPKS